MNHSELTRRKILVFTDWFLPGFRAGGPIRSIANLVDTLDDEFYIVTRITDHHSTTPYPGIQPETWTRRSERVQVLYLFDQEMNSDRISALWNERRYDCVYLNSLFSPKFTLLPLLIWRRKGRRERLVLAPRGMLKPGALSVKSGKKSWFIRLARWSGLFNGIIWHATSEEEVGEIKRWFGLSADIQFAPNLPSPVGISFSHPEKKKGQLRLVSIARISPEKGILEALTYLRDANLTGDVSVVFYGVQQNQEYLNECKKMAQLIQGVAVDFAGEIAPDRIPGVLAGGHFFYMTTRGENFGHAIAEALQHGTPIIISDRTPWRGIESTGSGWDLPLTSESIVPVLRKCLEMDNEEYTRMCRAAFEYGSGKAKDPEAIEANRKLFSSHA